jgi:flavin reductase
MVASSIGRKDHAVTAISPSLEFAVPQRPCVTPSDFVSAMARAATGVSVVTTAGPAGRFGITVSAVSSVSAEPPMVLACINRKSPAVKAVSENKRFAVNMLADRQASVARTFSGRPDLGAPYDFSTHDWRMGETGLPCLAGAAAHFECEVERAIDAGSHRIFIGRVVIAEAGAIDPLVYAGRDFRRPAPLDQTH